MSPSSKTNMFVLHNLKEDRDETNWGTIIFPFEFVTLEHNVSPLPLQEQSTPPDGNEEIR